MSIFNKGDSREKLLRTVQEYAFAVQEAVLYLDTHPDDKNAQVYFDRYNDLLQKAVQEYEAQEGPLSTNYIEASKSGWTWINGPFPWQED